MTPQSLTCRRILRLARAKRSEFAIHAGVVRIPPIEPITAVIPVETLAEVAAAWRERLAQEGLVR